MEGTRTLIVPSQSQYNDAIKIERVDGEVIYNLWLQLEKKRVSVVLKVTIELRYHNCVWQCICVVTSMVWREHTLNVCIHFSKDSYISEHQYWCSSVANQLWRQDNFLPLLSLLGGPSMYGPSFYIYQWFCNQLHM